MRREAPFRPGRVAAAARRRLRRWARRQVGPARPVVRPPVAGLVEEFTADRVSGWVTGEVDGPPQRVRLMLNDLEVTAAWAASPRSDRTTPASHEARRFDLRLRDIWSYAGPRDKLQILVDDRPLPILGHGTARVPERAGKHAGSLLAEKLSDGFVFGQTGRLQLSKKRDVAWQAAVMSLYGEVAEIVAEVYGYDVFLFYGSLLGAVREGTVIGHDVDFDVAYVSEAPTPRAAALELQALGLRLVDRGFHVRCAHTSLHVYDRNGSDARIDVFHTYFDAAGVLRLPFGAAGTIDVSRADWRGTTEIDFCGGRALVPANAEQVTELLYGPGWHSPQPGFDWARERAQRDWAGVLSVADVSVVYWADFYAHTRFDSPSPFAQSLIERHDLPRTVVDLGCGDGRDAVAFAAAGHSVLGLDYSVGGIAIAREVAKERELVDLVRFEVCDLGDSEQLRAQLRAVLDSTQGSVLWYLRFLLHAVSAPVEEVLLATLSDLTRPGDLLAVEFRTTGDEKRPKAYPGGRRRFLDGPAFGRALVDQHGFGLLDEHQGTGLSPHGNEDPDLYRVIARRT